MRVLLINPWSVDVMPQVSIGHLAGYLRHHGVDVQSIDAGRLHEVTGSPDIIGISIHSFAVPAALRVAAYCRKTWPAAKVVGGGHHPSALPDQMMRTGLFDRVVRGRGEKPLLSMCGVEESEDHGDIPPDYRGLLSTGGGITGLPGPIVPVVTSFGCPFKCAFCASADFWGGRWYPRDVNAVLDELETLSPGVNFMMEDDNFLANPARAIAICEGIKERMPGRAWCCTGRAESLSNAPMMQALKESGCTTVWTGCESFSQDTLDRMRKHTTVERMRAGLRTAIDHGIETMCQFIIGFPGDTQADVDATVANIVMGREITHIGRQVCWILPGTVVCDEAKARGFSEDAFLAGVPTYTYEHPAGQLQAWAAQLSAAGR